MKKLTVIGLVLVMCLLVPVSCAAPPPPMPAPAPTAPLPAIPHTLDDLAYIQAEGRPYSDNADPEPEGAEITILWYDTESELICFEDVPVKVIIEIFAAKSEEFSRPFTESVYKGEHHIDSYYSNIRIPFEQIKANPGIHHRCGGANITVLTPQQEDFSVEGILVPLCPKPPLKPPPVPAPLPAPSLQETVSSLDNPGKLSQWMIANITTISRYEQYKETGINYRAPPDETFETREGCCADKAIFACYVLQFHDYQAEILSIKVESDESKNHGVCVYHSDDSLYSINNGIMMGPYRTYEDIASDHHESWSEYSINYSWDKYQKMGPPDKVVDRKQ
ncbi:hypothetical protein ES708_19148 [subsurface metagenome]